VLDLILKDLPKVSHPDLLVGLGTADDAGVFRITPEIALIQTVDFFTPIVDDPYAYGQIAAANSLSDVYAMGGRPITAMNICGFPSDDVPPEMMAEVLKGAFDKVTESGALLVGGHSVEDVEPIFGLSVTTQ
jgi:selenide,water dikinase